MLISARKCKGVAELARWFRTSLAPKHLRDLGIRHSLHALACWFAGLPCTLDTDSDLQPADTQLNHYAYIPATGQPLWLTCKTVCTLT